VAITPQEVPVNINVLANDKDPDGDVITIVSATQAQNGTVFVNGTFITYTPNYGFRGNNSFTYTITDGEYQATATVTVVVTPVNHAPVAINYYGETYPGVAITINVLANDTDRDGNTITVISVTSPSGGVSSFTASNGVTYIPSATFVGDDIFQYTISDGFGDTATASVYIHVLPYPVAVPDNSTTYLNQSVVVPVLANDIGEGLSVLRAINISVNHTKGSFIVDQYNITYIPPVGFIGEDYFLYEMQDRKGTVSNWANVSILVTCIPCNCSTGYNCQCDGSCELAPLPLKESTTKKSNTPAIAAGVSVGAAVGVGAAAAFAYFKKKPEALQALNPFKTPPGQAAQVIMDNPLYETSAFAEYTNPVFEGANNI